MSGHRSAAEQQRLWDARATNPFPVARPGTSLHGSGTAADVTVGGRPIQLPDRARRPTAPGDTPLIRLRELHGQRDLTYAEATSILGERIGIPDLPYVQLPPAQMVGALAQIGFSRDFALLHVEFAGALSAGTVAATEERSAANTTPTRFEEFAAELAGVRA